MNRKELIDKIVFECVAGEGFLVELRARNFITHQFEELVTALKSYREIIKNEEYTDRAVAYSLHFLYLGLLAAYGHYPRNDEERLIIGNALTLAEDLITEILAPEWMTGPLPPEYE